MTSAMYRRASTPREALGQDIISDLRTYAAHAQHIGQAFASLNNLGQADLHALLAVMEAERAGQPLTAGALAQELNFSTSSITALVDRLERAGHIYRDRDPVDRRKIFLRYAEPGAQVARGFFTPLAVRTDQVMNQFTEAELATVHRFLRGIVESMKQHRDDLRTAHTGPGNHA